MDLKKINLRKIRDFSRTSPIYFSLGFTLLAILVHETFSGLFRLLPDNVWMDILNELVFIIWPVALVLIFGFGFIFRRRGIRATVGAALPMFLGLGFMLVWQLVFMIRDPATEWKTPLEIFTKLLILLGVGFREEILYRGVVANAVARKYGSTTKGLWITAFISGVTFASIHLTNVFHGVSLTGTLMQTFSAIFGGVFFCAIYLRGGSIWAIALLHSLNDLFPVITSTFTNAEKNLSEVQVISNYRPGLIQIIFLAGYLLVAAFLLRKSKRQKIFDRIQKLNSSEEANF